MAVGKCGHCGYYHDLEVMCWRIRAVEYRTDGTVKRMEYWEPRTISVPSQPEKLETAH